MRRILLISCIALLLLSCKGKKGSLQEGDVIDITDFIEFFPEKAHPIRIADTTLTRRTTDSSLISYKIFIQFIPDSILAKDFGKGVKPKLYPLGRTREKGREIYLFVKAVNGNKRVGYMACFSKDEKFLNALALVRTGFDSYSSAYGVLDNKFQITTYREKKTGTGTQFKRNVYIFNEAVNEFTLIMTEPNEEIIEQITNPIDTFPQKNKFSGDYVKSKRNFIAVRDAKRNEELLFFIHFEKDNGECIGELKGNMKMISKNTGQYQAPGNPCTLEFDFEGNSISIQETGGCGSYRNIKCFFEGSYPKKIITKPPIPPKKK